MILRDEIKQRIADFSCSDIALKMGYSKRGSLKVAQRVHHVLQSENLGLDSGNYDFRFSNKEFLFCLCEVIGVKSEKCRKEVERISSDISKERTRHKPWIFIETNFKRKSEPIFALAAMENLRRLQIPKEIASLPLNIQIPHLKAIVQRHHSESKGMIDMWGTILSYQYFYTKHRSLVFSTEGTVLTQEESSFTSCAALRIKGKNLFKA